MDITGHRRELTKRNYDHRSIKHKLDNADYINNIKEDSDFGPPEEMRLDKNPANSSVIAQKSVPLKVPFIYYVSTFLAQNLTYFFTKTGFSRQI